MSKNEKSQFQNWFRQQFGPVPGGDMTYESLSNAAMLGEEAKKILNERDKYNAKYIAAMYAWNVSDNQKV